MFEVVGMIAVWLVGLAASFIVPIVGGLWVKDSLGVLVVGFWGGLAMAAAYVIASVIYLAVT